MKQLQARFGKTHPELEGFEEPPAVFGWLITAYFRLHRRRHYAEMGGIQPLTYQELTLYCGNVIRLDRSLEPLFFRCMEATDNAVLFDQHELAVKQRKAEEEARKKPARRGPRK